MKLSLTYLKNQNIPSFLARVYTDFPKASQIFQDIRSCKQLIFPGPKDFSQDRIVTIYDY